MHEYQGFWSYVHDDDLADGGRIVRLARDVSGQFEMLTGESIALFLDKDGLQWGDDWRQQVDASLASVAFFLAVLTPRYFLSAECRRELQYFVRRAKDLGVEDLVLPLLYVDVPALHEDEPSDALIEVVVNFQWEDWRDTRFADVTSESYRRAVSRLAARLVDANRRVELLTPPTVPSTPSDDEEDDAPVLIDLIAGAEEALPGWSETLLAMGEEIKVIGTAMRETTEQIHRADTRGSGFAARARIVRVLALRMAEPAGRIQSLGDDYTRQMHEVDGGFRTLISVAQEQANAAGADLGSVCEFFDTLRALESVAGQALGQVQEMIEAAGPLERMSRDLRPPLRKMRKGLTIMMEAREITAEWTRLVDSTGIRCPDDATQVPKDSSDDPSSAQDQL